MSAKPGPTLPGERLRALLLGMCRQARADLRRLPRDPGPAVHALRVRMKKLRALLRLAAPVLPPEALRPLRADARAVRQAVAACRDAEVAQALANKLVRRHGLPPLKLRLPTDSPPDLKSVTGIRRRLSRMERRVASLPLGTLTRRHLQEVYVDHYRRCRRLAGRCRRHPQPPELHAWRKRIKELQHLGLALVALRAGWPATRTRIAPARALGRRLGRLQDLAVLNAALPDEVGDAWRRLLSRRRQRWLKQAFEAAELLLGQPARKLRVGRADA